VQVLFCWLQLSVVQLTPHLPPLGHAVSTGVCVQPMGVQASVVQSMLSLHSEASQHTAQPLPQHLVPIWQSSNRHEPFSQRALVWHFPACLAHSAFVEQSGDLVQPWPGVGSQK
jgi:hypothetical protein